VEVLCDPKGEGSVTIMSSFEHGGSDWLVVPFISREDRNNGR